MIALCLTMGEFLRYSFQQGLNPVASTTGFLESILRVTTEVNMDV